MSYDDERINLRIKSFELAKEQFTDLSQILEASEIIYKYLAENVNSIENRPV